MTAADPVCERCSRRAVVVYTSPDRRRYRAYCSAHYLLLETAPAGAICARIPPPRQSR